ncbi:hypothetical protein KIN20_016206 [Parelaphostrongylus tenuis]|uniref:Uncharacterized protein n=1 Tax=Parelaphostrongylus tenuis TaxID=148309 RepID=A0AAD5N150_PARTN|nr:hypothetical protein KIN20_016206 [Parelaphostrongylus tenuis]
MNGIFLSFEFSFGGALFPLNLSRGATNSYPLEVAISRANFTDSSLCSSPVHTLAAVRNMFNMLKEYYCDQYLEGNLWRRIVGGSRLICDSIRLNAKDTLRRKFDDLLSRSYNMILRRHTDTANEEQASHNRTSNAPRNSTVTVLGGITLPDGARSLLELGPSFSPSQPISKVSLRKVACGLHDLQDQLRKKAELKRLIGMNSK